MPLAARTAAHCDCDFHLRASLPIVSKIGGGIVGLIEPFRHIVSLSLSFSQVSSLFVS